LQSVQRALKEFISTEGLPDAYLQTAEQWFIPLAEDILRQISRHQGTFILGINGCQGSGKSTLAALLVILLRDMMGVRSINLSLDDFYLPLATRKAMAAGIHPLLRTRGVPGTHDIDLALQTLGALQQQGEVAIPRFNKATDDRLTPESQWPVISGPVDVVILEGWCLGLDAQPISSLTEPVNELEQEEDADGSWRHFVNEKLASEYQVLFSKIDMLLMLKAPGFENVLEWRNQQERKLAASKPGEEHRKIMSKNELRRFISHYERLTRHALASLAEKADVVYQLGDDQLIKAKLKG
tara:strand:- start:363 stop:1253 length:891 start_codon:yes stop_codon:yes gene_type:complete